MRTRIYNKMTTPEVEEYLARGGDTIFIAVGVTETHGNLTVDCETVYPEAVACLLAEKADGLAMINLPYFYPGGTVTSPVTVHVSIRESYQYLMKICHSLVDQGFKRLFLTSSHGPAGLYIDAFVRDFFEQTMIHPCHITNLDGKQPDYTKPRDPDEMRKRNLAFYGAYKIMNQIEYLPVDPNASGESDVRGAHDPALDKFAPLARKFGGVASLVFSDPSQHNGGTIFKSEEERMAACIEGEKILREMVDEGPILELKEALGDYQEYAQRMLKKFPRIKRAW